MANTDFFNTLITNNGPVLGVLLILIFGFIFNFIQSKGTVDSRLAVKDQEIEGKNKVIETLTTANDKLLANNANLIGTVKADAENKEQQAARDTVITQALDANLRVLNEIRDIATSSEPRTIVEQAKVNAPEVPINPRSKYS